MKIFQAKTLMKPQDFKAFKQNVPYTLHEIDFQK